MSLEHGKQLERQGKQTAVVLTLREILEKYSPQKEIFSNGNPKNPVEISAWVSRNDERRIVYCVPGSAKFIQEFSKTKQHLI